MLNWSRKEALTLLAILVIVLGFALVLHHPKQESESGNDQNGPNDLPFTAIVLTLEAAFTGALALYAIRSYNETRRSAERQLRAYVTLMDSDIDKVHVGAKPRVDLAIENTG